MTRSIVAASKAHRGCSCTAGLRLSAVLRLGQAVRARPEPSSDRPPGATGACTEGARRVRLGTTLMLAHIAGIPVEETALSLAPVATVLGGLAVAYLRSGRSRSTSVKDAVPRARAAP